jgi:hypothetical protein
MIDYSSLFNNMINGLFVGIGAATGTWLVNHHFVRHLEKLEKQIILKDAIGIKDCLKGKHSSLGVSNGKTSLNPEQIGKAVKTW